MRVLDRYRGARAYYYGVEEIPGRWHAKLAHLERLETLRRAPSDHWLIW